MLRLGIEGESLLWQTLQALTPAKELDEALLKGLLDGAREQIEGVEAVRRHTAAAIRCCFGFRRHPIAGTAMPFPPRLVGDAFGWTPRGHSMGYVSGRSGGGAMVTSAERRRRGNGRFPVEFLVEFLVERTEQDGVRESARRRVDVLFAQHSWRPMSPGPAEAEDGRTTA